MEYINKDSKLKDLLKDEHLGKYMKYIYYDYLDNLHLEETVSAWSSFALRGLNWFKEKIINNEVKQYFINTNRPDVNFIHITHKNNSKVMIMVSGGGLTSVCNSHEALPMSEYFFNQGFDILILTYGINKDAYWDNSTKDLVCLVKYMINNQKELNIDPIDYTIIGGSAGGFVVGLFGTNNFGYKKYNLPKPLCIGLLYPVINFSYYNSSTMNACLQDKINEENIHLFAINEHIDNDYPPTFLIHSTYDKAVSVNNSRCLKEALEKVKVPCYYMEFPYKDHGFSIAYNFGQEGWANCFMTFYKHCLEKINYID